MNIGRTLLILNNMWCTRQKITITIMSHHKVLIFCRLTTSLFKMFKACKYIFLSPRRCRRQDQRTTQKLPWSGKTQDLLLQAGFLH